MIGKWLQELQDKGEILDYDITLDDITKEYIVHYYVAPPPEPLTFVIEFTIDPITKEVVFKGATENESR